MIKWLSKITGHTDEIISQQEAICKGKITDEVTRLYARHTEMLDQQKANFDRTFAEMAESLRQKDQRPTELDIHLLESLVTRGVNQNDIEALLNITSKEFEKWKDNIEVDRIVKIKPKQEPELFNLHHPSLAGQTELAFEAGLIKFYRFKEEYRMPIGRYKYVYKRFKEADLRMTRETMQEYLKQIEESLNGTKKQINLSTALRLIYNMKTWLTIPFEPEAVKRLAAVTFFTEDEDLSTFDEKKGQEKIKLWERNKVHDFFTTAPIGALLNVNSSLITSLEEYLTEIQEITKALISDLQEKSLENT